MTSLLPGPAVPVARSLVPDPPGPVAADPAVPPAGSGPAGGGGRWRSRLGKIAIGLVAAVVGFEALYLIGANGFFASKKLQGIIRGDDGNFLLKYDRLWSWVPGRYHVEGLTLWSRGMTVQWQLDIEEASFTTNPLTLLRRRFEVSRVKATGVGFRLRTTEPPEKAQREENAWFAPMAPFADLAPVPLAPPTPVDELWTVSIENIDAWSRELWVQQFRHGGISHAQGKFTLTPGLEFGVGPASLDFLGGFVAVGDSMLASTLDGHVETLISLNSLADPGRTTVFPHVDARVALDAQIDSVASWRVFLPEGWTLADGSGQLRLRAGLTRGLFDGGSRASYETSRLVARDPSVGLVAPAEAVWAVAEDGESSQLLVNVPSAQLSKDGYQGPSPQLSGLTASFLTGPLDAAALWELRRIEAVVGGFEAPDVRFFNGEALSGKEVVLSQGHARAHGDLVFDAPDTAGGNLFFTVEGLTARYQGDQGHAEVAFFAHLPPSSLAHGLSISSARLDLRDVFARARGKSFERWWTRLDLGPSTLEISPQLAFRGPLSIRAKDASPALAFALDEQGIEGVLRDHLRTDQLEARLTVAADPDAIDLRLPAVEGGPYQLSGRVLFREEARCGALLVERDPLSLGIKLATKKTSLRPMVGRAWLAEHTGAPGGQVPGCPRPGASAP